MNKKEKLKIGGQAIIEGVMMITKNSWALACREEDGNIVTRAWERSSILLKNKFLNLPFIRGFITLFEMLILGYKALDISANIVYSDEEKSWKDNFIFIFALLTIIIIFFLVPFLGTKFFFKDLYDNNQALLNIIIGSYRLILFIIYLSLISLSKDVKRIFQYHGAEHKAIYCFESKKELTPENAQEFPKEHPRCGTSLVLVTAIFAIVISSIVDTILFNYLNIDNNPLIRMFVHILLIPFVAGTAYEFNRFGSNHQDNIILKSLIMPGLLLQKITTKEPSLEQLEVSINSLNLAVEINNKKTEQHEEKEN